MSWKKRLEQILRSGLRYCFSANADGTFPEINEDEFSGGHNGGFLSFIVSTVLSFRRRCFFDGYRAGVLDAIEDLKQMPVGESLTVVTSDFGASRSWDKYEKDLDEIS